MRKYRTLSTVISVDCQIGFVWGQAAWHLISNIYDSRVACAQIYNKSVAARPTVSRRIHIHIRR